MEFWTLMVEAGWNELPLLGVFLRGLRGQLRDAVPMRGRPLDLRSLIELATELDAYLNQQRPDHATFTSSLLPPHSIGNRSVFSFSDHFHSAILGSTWFSRHNPKLNWTEGFLTGWSVHSRWSLDQSATQWRRTLVSAWFPGSSSSLGTGFFI